MTTDDTRLFRSCVGALMYYVLDRADAQLEEGTLGSYLRALTTGAMEALRRATRFLLGTQDAYVKPERPSNHSGTCGLLRQRLGW